VAIAEWYKTMNFISPLLYGVGAIIFTLYIQKLIGISKSDRSKIQLLKQLGELYEISIGQQMPNREQLWREAIDYINSSLCSEMEKEKLIKHIGRISNSLAAQNLPLIIADVTRLIKNH